MRNLNRLTLSGNLYKQIKCALRCAVLVFMFVPVIAQTKPGQSSKQLRAFNKELKQTNVNFSLPAGFKEIKTVNDENFSFDYAIEIPGVNFEIWIQIRSEKENLSVYEKTKVAVANPDSLYLEIGKTQASAFAGSNNYMERTIPAYALGRYNADAGKTYIVNLPDLPVTKHYKYAMVVVLQKSHVGTILAVCLGNELGPGFFKNVNLANSCLKFNPS